MKQPERDPEELEAWLDGSLDGDRARSFEARLEAEPGLARELELSHRIEDTLRRRFQLPEAPVGAAGTLDRKAEPGFVRRAQRTPPRRSWQVLVTLAAAAVALLLLRTGHEPEPDSSERVEPGRVARVIPAIGRSVDPDPGVCVGPLEDSAPGIPLSRVARPDLETLYSEATAWAADRSLSVCGPGAELSGALEASYGEEVELRPEAEGRLQGPFASSEWPTGFILAGYSEDAPAVLVAERQSTHECCLALQLPPDSHLQLFTWRVGGLLLTEITPLAEPRLLDYFGEVY